MSSAPTDCRVPEGRTPDPTDAKADGNFGNHRAGYGDRLDSIITFARRGWSLPGPEGLVLVQEIDRLREQLRDTHTEVFHLGEKLSFVERERDQLTSLPAERILWALVNPSPTVLHAMASTFDVSKSLHLAIKTASQEVAGDR